MIDICILKSEISTRMFGLKFMSYSKKYRPALSMRCVSSLWLSLVVANSREKLDMMDNQPPCPQCKYRALQSIYVKWNFYIGTLEFEAVFGSFGRIETNNWSAVSRKRIEGVLPWPRTCLRVKGTRGKGWQTLLVANSTFLLDSGNVITESVLNGGTPSPPYGSIPRKHFWHHP